MKKFDSAEEILDFAISEEEKAAAFYERLAQQVNKAWMKKVFHDFAQEEQGHKQKLLEVKKGHLADFSNQEVLDLKIGDYLVDEEPSTDMDYQKALILAMKKEKVAFRMYSDLAQTTSDKNLRTLLLGLAQEEAKHKLRFEIEYDERILQEN